ncbi:MAG: hypothetical protein ACHBNF_04950 [Chromatiales bacterium]
MASDVLVAAYRNAAPDQRVSRPQPLRCPLNGECRALVADFAGEGPLFL